MKKYKQYYLTSLCVFVLLASLHIIILVIVDPLSIVRHNFLEKEFFIKEMRFQIAGLINNFDIDSAIIGTSMAENFDVKEANELLRGNFLNLSMSGGLLSERAVVLSYFLSEKNAKNVIISLDNSTSIQRNNGIPLEAWSFLYNEQYWDDYKVYLNQKYLPYINCHSAFQYKIIALLLGECPVDNIKNDVTRLSEWKSIEAYQNRFGGVENWIKNKEDPQIKQDIKIISNAVSYIEKNIPKENFSNRNVYNDYKPFEETILPLIKLHPETEFFLFFPPYSIYKYAVDYQNGRGDFDDYKELVKNVVLVSEHYPNVNVYWFSDYDFVEDLANYKDLGHYSAKENSLILKKFAKKQSIINKDNYREKLDQLTFKAAKIDLRAFLEKFSDEHN